jgi:hypothetical protein
MAAMATSIEPAAPADLAIRVPSTGALFDAWSVAPLASRPLSDEARERIIDAWSEIAERVTGRPRLELVLPAAERASADEAAIVEAIHLDLRSMKTEARHHWFRRALNPRESRIGILVFFVSLAIGAVIDVGSDDGGLATLLSQTFIVLAWVALWAPAHRLLTAASFRLGRRYFAELAEADISLRWD